MKKEIDDAIKAFILKRYFNAFPAAQPIDKTWSEVMKSSDELPSSFKVDSLYASMSLAQIKDMLSLEELNHTHFYTAVTALAEKSKQASADSAKVIESLTHPNGHGLKEEL